MKGVNGKQMQFIKNFAIRIICIKGATPDINDVFYICGSDILPPPLSKTEEECLLIKLNSGDNSVKSELTERNLRLVVYIAKKFENTGINVEDLISIGTIGLIKSINTFKPD